MAQYRSARQPVAQPGVGTLSSPSSGWSSLSSSFIWQAAVYTDISAILRYSWVSMSRRLTAALLTVALIGAGVAPCAGWESTAKARHDCCVDGQCPGQIETGRHAGAHSGGIPQAAADQCCATSEQQSQQHATQFAGPSFFLLPPAENVFVTADELKPPERPDLHVAPIPSPPTRLHLLFSVFLV